MSAQNWVQDRHKPSERVRDSYWRGSDRMIEVRGDPIFKANGHCSQAVVAYGKIGLRACFECWLKCHISNRHVAEGGLESPGGTNVPEELWEGSFVGE